MLQRSKEAGVMAQLWDRCVSDVNLRYLVLMLEEGGSNSSVNGGLLGRMRPSSTLRYLTMNHGSKQAQLSITAQDDGKARKTSTFRKRTAWRTLMPVMMIPTRLRQILYLQPHYTELGKHLDVWSGFKSCKEKSKVQVLV